jgi:hypothetical protein
MKLKLSDWASIAEILSGVAVVVTLVFLVVGIQENTEITRASVYSDLLDSINEIDRLTYSDPELFELNEAFDRADYSELTETQRSRIRAMIVVRARAYEKAYFSRQYEVLGEAEWERIEGALCYMQRRAIPLNLDLTQTPLITQEFRNHIQSSCGELLPQ